MSRAGAGARVRFFRYMLESSRLWIEALKALDADPSAQVTCPERGDGFLEATWIPATPNEAGPGELGIRCPSCGAVNCALYSERPTGL